MSRWEWLLWNYRFTVLFVTFTQDRVEYDVGSEDTTCLCINCKAKELPCLQPYHSRVVEQHVYVWKSRIEGFGLFARHSMRENDIICLYSGERRSDAVEETNKYTCRIQGDSKGSESFYIDGQDQPYYSGRWINHSNDPNARLVVPLGGVCDKVSQHHKMCNPCRMYQTYREKRGNLRRLWRSFSVQVKGVWFKVIESLWCCVYVKRVRHQVWIILNTRLMI